MFSHKSQKWKNKRTIILKRDSYLCKECARFGKRTIASTVHHIFPVELFPELAFVNINLISLCESCHNKMHDRITDTITETGKRWQSKISPHLSDHIFNT